MNKMSKELLKITFSIRHTGTDQGELTEVSAYSKNFLFSYSPILDIL